MHRWRPFALTVSFTSGWVSRVQCARAALYTCIARTGYTNATPQATSVLHLEPYANTTRCAPSPGRPRASASMRCPAEQDRLHIDRCKSMRLNQLTCTAPWSCLAIFCPSLGPALIQPIHRLDTEAEKKEPDRVSAPSAHRQKKLRSQELGAPGQT